MTAALAALNVMVDKVLAYRPANKKKSRMAKKKLRPEKREPASSERK
jgi:hypothetical protein